jgi:uncharacterized protein YndB with AHSA1/START domain
MPKASAMITIARPIEDVFAALTDVERTRMWFPWDVEEHWTSPPPVGIGSTRHAVIRMGRRRSENDAIVTEFDPPHRAAIRGTSANAPFDAVLAFEPVGHGTRVDVTLEFAFRGPLRIAGPPFAWWYGRAWRRGLKQLRQLMETDQL